MYRMASETKPSFPLKVMKKISNIDLKVIEKIQLNTVMLTYRFMNFVLRALAFIIYQKNVSPAKILIFRTGSLGDSLCAIPVISAIRKRYPDSQIDILINPGKASSTLVSLDQLLSPSVYNKTINYFGLSLLQTVSLLRKQKYNLVIQLPQGDAPFLTLLRDMFFYRTIAGDGWGWEVGKVFFFKKIQEKCIHYDREVVRLAHIAAHNRINVDTNDFPLNVTVQDKEFVQNYFEKAGISHKRIIGVCIGSKRSQNRWPLKNFKYVVDRFADNYNIIIIGGEEDKEAASSIAESSNVFNLCGLFTPMQSAVAFTKCLVVLSNDTGPMHLSYAVGTPTVALFSSRDFKGAWFPPEDGKNIVFRSEGIECALCLSNTCANNICMQAISPLPVIAEMYTLIHHSSIA